MTNFNKWTNTLRWLCVRGELETGTDCYILTQVLLTIAALLGCSTVGHWGPKAQSPLSAAGSQFQASCLQLSSTPTDSSRLCPGYIFCLVPTCFRLFTQVHLFDWRLGRARVNMLHKYTHTYRNNWFQKYELPK